MPKGNEVLYLGLCDTLEESGWGICSKYLNLELSKLTNVVDLQKRKLVHSFGKIQGTILHAIADVNFRKTVDLIGDFNAGYCFFENVLPPVALSNMEQYDLIFAGSKFCEDLLNNRYGYKATETLIQGVDHDIFNERGMKKDAKWSDYFVIFSGGKFELRKGQDIVLAAVKILQEKYPDIILMNAWENRWPQSMETMAASPYLKFINKGDSWTAKMAAIYAVNRMFMGRLISYPITPQRELRKIIANSDLGLFLSRCEGGTNLAMMEYMACGRPVVATYTSGHRDVLTDDNAFLVKEVIPQEIKANGTVIAEWDEPNLEEVIAQIESAYNNRERASQIGLAGAKSMKKWTWGRTARQVLSSIKDNSTSIRTPKVRDDFPEYLNQLGLLGNAIEIGVQAGKYSEYLRSHWRGKHLFLVDRWRHVSGGYDDIANVGQNSQDELYRSVCDKFKKDESITVIRKDSVAASKDFPDEFFDFVYIDADHSYEAVKKDLKAWWPKVKRGGIFAGHDFVDIVKDYYTGKVMTFGVKRAVLEFFEKDRLMFSVTRENESMMDSSSWFLRKPL